jgi:membrane-bound lytic murein transglycosylase A
MIRVIILFSLFLLNTLLFAVEYRELSFNSLKGWSTHDPIPALQQMKKSLSYYSKTGVYKTVIPDLKKLNLDTVTPAQARSFVERHFKAVQLIESHNKNLVTGYYVPTFKASKTRTDQYNVPVYKNPKSKNLEHRVTREKIMKGALDSANLELAWVRDIEELFNLQMQGSGILEFENGDILHVNYDGGNGFSYSSISQYMIDKGYINKNQRNADAVYEYLRKNPTRRDEILYHNKSFTFFKTNETNKVTGAQGVELMPFRSVAVDKRFIPLGSLLYLQTKIPKLDDFDNIKAANKKPTTAFNQLCVAGDQGGAIKGANRADIYFGSGKEAEVLASYMHYPSRFILLVAR